jgi:hypothetical protein
MSNITGQALNREVDKVPVIRLGLAIVVKQRWFVLRLAFDYAVARHVPEKAELSFSTPQAAGDDVSLTSSVKIDLAV